ncbi:MAG: GntR family transcriptional regulator [Acidobacteriota bacterium]
MRIRIDTADARPIWSQLEDQFRLLIGSGALAPGSAVPSVRDLARELVVNPATISKAYRSLTASGLLEVRRGQGTFVAADALQMGDAERGRELAQAAGRYAVTAKSLQVPLERAEQELQSSWNGLDAAPSADAARETKGEGDDDE